MNDRYSFGAKRLLRIIIAGVIVIGLGGLLVWGFLEGRGEAALEARREQPVNAAVQVSHDGAGAATITLTLNLQKRAGIRVIQPKTTPYQRQIQAYGSVLDLQQFTDLSNAIANTKAQLAIAAAKLAASQPAFQRARMLHNDRQNISTAQLQAAEAAYRSDEASFRAAQVQTQNAAASAYQAWGPVLGRSLADGTALAKELIEHRKVLIQVTLPLGVSLSRAPQTASIETTTGQHVRIDFVSAATRTDPKIQGLSFFYTADAASEALPGMNVIAFLPVGQPTPAVAVPASAVVWLHDRAWVYLETRADAFTRYEIPTTQPQPGGGYVVLAAASNGETGGDPQGLPAHTPLVVAGAQALLSQEFSAQIQIGGD